MKILFLSHYFPPEGNAPASRVYALAKNWQQAGHDVTVLTCTPNVPNGIVYDGYKNRLYQRETVDGINVIRIWTYMAPNKGTVKRIVNYLSYMITAIFFAFFRQRPDVMIATSPQFFCGWAGVVLKYLFFKRVKFILEIRDIWPESIVAVGAGLPASIIWMLEKMELMMYAAADYIVTVGEGYKQRLIDKGVKEENLSIIMNGVDCDLFSPREPDKQLIEQWQVKDKFICSYIGTVGMACGLEVVIRAAEQLKKMQRDDIVFMVVGDGAYRENLEQMIESKKLDNVIITGRQPKELMPAFLAITDACLVHLKKTDLFSSVMPSKIFEAAGMAKPIIIAVKGQATQIVMDAGAGISIEPENEHQLIDAVVKLADDPGVAKQMGCSGNQKIVTEYNREKLSEEYLKLLVTVKG